MKWNSTNTNENGETNYYEYNPLSVAILFRWNINNVLSKKKVKPQKQIDCHNNSDNNRNAYFPSTLCWLPYKLISRWGENLHRQRHTRIISFANKPIWSQTWTVINLACCSHQRMVYCIESIPHGWNEHVHIVIMYYWNEKANFPKVNITCSLAIPCHRHWWRKMCMKRLWSIFQFHLCTL